MNKRKDSPCTAPVRLLVYLQLIIISHEGNNMYNGYVSKNNCGLKHLNI